jgi:DNA-binding IclR family transcriptional regulator
MDELATSIGETVHLGVQSGSEVVHLDGVLPDQLVLTGLRVGKRTPAHCTALGKVLLAGADFDFFEKTFERFTDATRVDPTKLADELRVVALHGYATDLEEFSPGLHCVAAPVRDASTRIVGAISLSGPSFRFTEEILHGDAANAVTRAATQLSQKLGSPI